MPDRNLIQDSSVPSTAEPIAAPMTSGATVPTTISESAVETRSQIDSKLAISARPSHSAASAQTPVIPAAPAAPLELPLRNGATDRRTNERRELGHSGSAQGRPLPTPSAR